MITRRRLLAGTGVAALLGAGAWLTRGRGGEQVAPRPLPEGGWQNWSGNAVCTPTQRAAPATAKELQTLLQQSDTPVRPVGAGHSFPPIACTDGVLLSLDQINSLEVENDIARCGAGIRLGTLSRQLAKKGRALPNLPDIDQQSYAGAAATATHGTGRDFPCLSAQIKAMRLYTASGEELVCSAEENPDIFSAARVSLGALGVMHEVSLATRPAFNLHRRTWFEPTESMLSEAKNYFTRHRHFEFYAIPHTGYCLAISHDETDEPASPRPPSADEDGLAELQFLRDWFSGMPSLRRWMSGRAIAAVPEDNLVSESWALLSSQRLTRFNEMEYHLPAGRNFEALEGLAEIIRTLEDNRSDAFFPIECRLTAPDDAWLSPFDQPRISIAVHAHYLEAHDYFFSLLEPVFRRYGGRPHWGKLHSLGAPELRELYPRMGDFLRVRRELDPKGRFLNPHLRHLFGE